MAKKETTIPAYTFQETSNPDVQRHVDRNGDWTHYFIVSKKKFVKAVNHILTLGYSKGPQFRAYLESHTKEEIAKTLREKGDEGSRTHMAIRDLIKGVKVTLDTKYPSELTARRMDPLNDDEWENLEAFKGWCDKYQPRWIAFEDTVATDSYAGTDDALMVITVPSGDKVFEKPFWGKDVLILLDWKSSAAVWSEYEAQLAAYWNAIKDGGKYDKFIKAYAGHIFGGIVRLGSQHASGYHFTFYTQKELEGEFLIRFGAAMIIADRYEPEYKFETEEMPTQFVIKVPKAKVPVAPKAKTKKTTKKLPI